MRIAFWDNYLCERGTTVALYDYAYYNQELLNNESLIFYNSSISANEQKVIEKFKKNFQVFGSPSFTDSEDVMIKNNIDLIYIIKGGENDGQISRNIKTCVHCVFSAHSPHGDIYSTIAPWVYGNDGKYPVVPHMINLPDHNKNLRERLNIPEKANVFGGYGGKDNFNIDYVKKIVIDLATTNPDIYFLFANFSKFCEDLPNLIHLPMMLNLDEKVSFINTCDAMLWARSDGEVMSMSQGEFSVRNKPIICTNIGYPGHGFLLGDKAIWYSCENDLKDILLNFNKEEVKNKDWNAYKQYTPTKVMEIFKKVYID
jgi:hypothetical protein